MPDTPKFDMSELTVAAVSMHEMYLELKKAGFNRGEALELLARTVAHGAGDFANNDQPDETP